MRVGGWAAPRLCVSPPAAGDCESTTVSRAAAVSGGGALARVRSACAPLHPPTFASSCAQLPPRWSATPRCHPASTPRRSILGWLGAMLSLPPALSPSHIPRCGGGQWGAVGGGLGAGFPAQQAHADGQGYTASAPPPAHPSPSEEQPAPWRSGGRWPAACSGWWAPGPSGRCSPRRPPPLAPTQQSPPPRQWRAPAASPRCGARRGGELGRGWAPPHRRHGAPPTLAPGARLGLGTGACDRGAGGGRGAGPQNGGGGPGLARGGEGRRGVALRALAQPCRPAPPASEAMPGPRGVDPHGRARGDRRRQSCPAARPASWLVLSHPAPPHPQHTPARAPAAPARPAPTPAAPAPRPRTRRSLALWWMFTLRASCRTSLAPWRCRTMTSGWCWRWPSTRATTRCGASPWTPQTA